MSYDELQAEYKRLRQVYEQRSAENAALKRQLEEYQQRLAEKEEQLHQLHDYEQQLAQKLELERQLLDYEQRLAEAQTLIADLQRRLYGAKSERLNDEQKKQVKEMARILEEQARREGPVSDQVLEREEPSEKKEKKDRQPRKRTPRHPIPQHLETEEIVLEPEVCPCAACGRSPERIGEEITEEIDRVPAKVIRRRIIRPKYACRCGEAGVAITPLPPRLIPQSKLGLGLAVYITLARFDDHLSYYNLERQFRERHDVVIPRQQMVQWMEHIAFWLQPVSEAIWLNMRSHGYLQIDETPVRVLDPEVRGKAAQGYLWFFAEPLGDVFLLFDRSRGLQPVRQRMSGFAGTIQTDAYEVYQALERREQSVQRIGCLAHARRRFYDALGDHGHQSLWFLVRIGLLYRIEDEARHMEVSERQQYRQSRAPALWEEIKVQAQQLQPKLLPKSSLGKAVNYLLNDYDALIGYLRDGRFEIDNNLVENDIRPTAVGRRRWLFIGHPDAGWRSAVLYTILVSCRRRGINPEHYLTDVLQRLPTLKHHQIHTLLPGNWTPLSEE